MDTPIRSTGEKELKVVRGRSKAPCRSDAPSVEGGESTAAAKDEFRRSRAKDASFGHVPARAHAATVPSSSAPAGTAPSWAQSTVCASTLFPALPGAGERAVMYRPVSSGSYEATEIQAIYEPAKSAEVRDSQGRSWRLYYTLNSEYSLCVESPDGSVPLRFLMNGSSRGYMKNLILDPEHMRLFILYSESASAGQTLSALAAYDLSTGQQKACLQTSDPALENISIGESGAVYACAEGQVHVLDSDLSEIRSLCVNDFIPAA